MRDREHWVVRVGRAISAIGLVSSASCAGIESSPTKVLASTPLPSFTNTSPPTETLLPTQTHASVPTETHIFPPIASSTPNYRATQEDQWLGLENAERGDAVELSSIVVTRIIQGGNFVWVEVNIPGEEGVTLLQSDCVKDVLTDTGQLGKQVDEGIYEPNVQIDNLRGTVKVASDIYGGILDDVGLKVPVIDLTEIENQGTTYNCDVATTDEEVRSSLSKVYKALRPYLEKIYPRLRQVGDIVSKTLDLIEQELDSRLTPSPQP
jgi:hypothetical protein